MKQWDKWVGAAALLAFASVFLWCGLSGVNFGTHWDEYRTIDSVRNSITGGVVLPGWYNYPSLTYSIAVVTALAHAPAVAGAHSVADARVQLAAFVESPGFTLALRSVLVVLTALSACFPVLAARSSGTGRMAAAVAGAFVLSSFPVLYHARWIAPDCLSLLAVAMTLAASLRAAHDGKAASLALAAACAGLATAAKYPAGIALLLPLLAASRMPSPRRAVIRALAIFTATFLLITPGAALDPFRFAHDVKFEMTHYARLGHGIYTVHAGWQHLVGITDFLAFRLDSRSSLLSLIVFAGAVGGAVIAWRTNRRDALMLTIVPVLYIAYMASQRVMIVRNLMLLVPFAAVLIAISVDEIAERTRFANARHVVPVGALLLLALNWPALIRSTRSLNSHESEWPRQIAAFVAAHPAKHFAVSPQVAKLLAAAPGARPAAIVPIATADAYLFVLGEHSALFSSETTAFAYRAFANRSGEYTVVAGADEIDLDYYPNWTGKPRVIAVDAPAARAIAAAHSAAP